MKRININISDTQREEFQRLAKAVSLPSTKHGSHYRAEEVFGEWRYREFHFLN